MGFNISHVSVAGGILNHLCIISSLRQMLIRETPRVNEYLYHVGEKTLN